MITLTVVNPFFIHRLRDTYANQVTSDIRLRQRFIRRRRRSRRWQHLCKWWRRRSRLSHYTSLNHGRNWHDWSSKLSLPIERHGRLQAQGNRPEGCRRKQYKEKLKNWKFTAIINLVEQHVINNNHAWMNWRTTKLKAKQEIKNWLKMEVQAALSCFPPKGNRLQYLYNSQIKPCSSSMFTIHFDKSFKKYCPFLHKHHTSFCIHSFKSESHTVSFE